MVTLIKKGPGETPKKPPKNPTKLTAFVSNKPPLPEPTPPPHLFEKKTLPSHRDVWISIPQPDRLSFTIPVSEAVYSSGVKPGASPEAVMLALRDFLLSGPLNCDVADSNTWPVGWKFISLLVGHRESPIRFEYIKVKGTSLRIECNPRKLGPHGALILLQLLDHPGCPLDPHKALEAAKITRLDVAVDIVGIEVAEVLAAHKDQAKRSMYVGSDGQLETLFIHRKLPKKKQTYDSHGHPKKLKHSGPPAGTVLIKIYDRRRERLSLLRPAPFGDAPVTRIEIVIKGLRKKHAFLANIGDLPDKFALVRAGFVGSQPGIERETLRRFTALRRTLPIDTAFRMLKLQKPPKYLASYPAKLEAAETVIVADLAGPATTWAGWQEGLKQTGLLTLLDILD